MVVPRVAGRAGVGEHLRVTLQGFAVLGICSFRVLCRTFLNAYYSKSQIVTRPPLDPELFSLDIVSDVY